MAFKFDFLNSKENKTQHEKDTREYKEQRQAKEPKPLTAEEIRGIVNREMNNATAKNQVIGYFDSLAASSVRTEAMLSELKEELEASLAVIKDTVRSSDSSEKLERIDESVRRVVELTGSIGQIDESVKRVAAMTGSIEQIDESVKRVAAMTGSIEQIDESVKRVAAMTENIEGISGSIEEMDRSVRQVAEAAERFEEIDRSIKRVEAMSESLGQIDESARNAARASEDLEAAIHKDNLIMYKTIKDELEDLKEKNRKGNGALRSGLVVSLIFNALTVIILAVMWILYFL
ncbi:MAG: hypothetical protein NC223_10285 [Butyrivibrio sp.]|nr:hypothetical protein [Butyrivibrio sp.]